VTFRDPEFDESGKQRIMRDYLGTEHSEISVGYSDIAGAFGEVVWHTEVPILRTAPVPIMLLSKLVRENSYKVVLTGEGADEILAGYDLFKEAKVRRFMEARPNSRLRPLLLQKLYPYLRNSPTRSVAFAKAFFGAPVAPFDMCFHSHAPRWNMTAMIKSFYSGDLRHSLGGSDPAGRITAYFENAGMVRKEDPLDCAQEIEMKTLLPGYLLSSQGDRMLMANSVEGRFPFLDHRLVEYCMRIPPTLRMKALQEKYILRKCMRHLLPRDIAEMVKQPYRAPDARSFLEPESGSMAEEMLSRKQVAENGYFDPAHVEKLVEKCRRVQDIGFKDNMAFIGILSTQILDHLFIKNFHIGDGEKMEGVRVIDRRSKY
jgi:asparagine synthase (glutamine-hydrolysing)